MPITRLFCEGRQDSSDALLLASILPDACLIEPVGGCDFLERIVMFHRAKASSATLMAIKDRDMLADDFTVTHQPQRWESRGGEHYGWIWERVEIENYLLDPAVVTALQPRRLTDITAYRAALDTVARDIAPYAAARNALARFRDALRHALPSLRDGAPCGKRQYMFPRGATLDVAHCHTFLETQVAGVTSRSADSCAQVITRFDAIRAVFLPTGAVFPHYLHFFAGKDLLWGLEPYLRQFSNYGNPQELLDDVAKALPGREDANFRNLVPEWPALYQSICA